MLRSLSIRDVVLIERLDIGFEAGLCVLTGETGAGKSILLDALGLAIGSRAESRLVRNGAERASVTATFEPPARHPIHALLDEHGIDKEDDGNVIVRRILGADGRSRAFVNDQQISVSLLRALGDMLVEVHGQFESQRLLNPAAHRDLLDAHGECGQLLSRTEDAHAAWRTAAEKLQTATEAMEKARRDEDYLRHAVDELASLDPIPGEALQLADQRTRLMNAEKLIEALAGAADDLARGGGAEAALNTALRRLEGVADKAGGALDDVIATLSRAAAEAAEGSALLERTATSLDLDSGTLERIEERLFALRALARKHDEDVDKLAPLLDDLSSQLTALEDGGQALKKLRESEVAARSKFAATAKSLSQARRSAGVELDRAVATELEPLRLGGATFTTLIETMDEADWGPRGRDRVAFQVATNPGAPSGPLNKIASGGELSRFMLALKVVLAQADPVPTLVFDEVDAGIGGAVAAAVGERLATLGGDLQVLVVTHSPQVAARGGNHWLVSKGDSGNGATETGVRALASSERTEEIARMLAGEEITDQARAAAESLLA